MKKRISLLLALIMLFAIFFGVVSAQNKVEAVSSKGFELKTKLIYNGHGEYEEVKNIAKTTQRNVFNADLMNEGGIYTLEDDSQVMAVGEGKYLAVETIDVTGYKYEQLLALKTEYNLPEETFKEVKKNWHEANQKHTFYNENPTVVALVVPEKLNGVMGGGTTYYTYKGMKMKDYLNYTKND